MDPKPVQPFRLGQEEGRPHKVYRVRVGHKDKAGHKNKGCQADKERLASHKAACPVDKGCRVGKVCQAECPEARCQA